MQQFQPAHNLSHTHTLDWSAIQFTRWMHIGASALHQSALQQLGEHELIPEVVEQSSIRVANEASRVVQTVMDTLSRSDGSITLITYGNGMWAHTLHSDQGEVHIANVTWVTVLWAEIAATIAMSGHVKMLARTLDELYMKDYDYELLFLDIDRVHLEVKEENSPYPEELLDAPDLESLLDATGFNVDIDNIKFDADEEWRNDER